MSVISWEGISSGGIEPKPCFVQKKKNPRQQVTVVNEEGEKVSLCFMEWQWKQAFFFLFWVIKGTSVQLEIHQASLNRFTDEPP